MYSKTIKIYLYLKNVLRLEKKCTIYTILGRKIAVTTNARGARKTQQYKRNWSNSIIGTIQSASMVQMLQAGGGGGKESKFCCFFSICSLCFFITCFFTSFFVRNSMGQNGHTNSVDFWLTPQLVAKCRLRKPLPLYLPGHFGHD